MEWLRGKLFGAHRDVFREALDATDEATKLARSVREQLEPYRLDDDPFVSMTRKHIMAEIFSAEQLANLHLGPPK